MPPEDEDNATQLHDLEAAFRKYVGERRRAKGFSQEELAARMRALGQPYWQGTVAKLEGPGRAVRLNEAAALARVLDFSLAEAIVVLHEADPDQSAAIARIDELIAQRNELARAMEEVEREVRELDRARDHADEQLRAAAERRSTLARKEAMVARELQAAVERANMLGKRDG